MRILLLSATELECRTCFRWLAENPDITAEPLVGGVGQLATAVTLQKRLLKSRPDCIIQAGIAGAAEKQDIGSVFVVNQEVTADLGADEPEGFRSLFDLKLADPDLFPFSAGALPNPYRQLLGILPLPVRTGLTVNHISTDKKMLEFRKQKYPMFVESMEGAALHYVALLEKIPFVQIRAVSNEAGDRDKSRWKIKESVAALNDTLQTLIQKLVTCDETYIRL